MKESYLYPEKILKRYLELSAENAVHFGYCPKCFWQASQLLEIYQFLKRILSDESETSEFQQFFSANQLSFHNWF